MVITDHLYRVILEGTVKEGQNCQEVQTRLAALFKVEETRIKALFIGRPTVIKSGIDEQRALKYQTALERAGAICRIEPEQTIPTPLPSPEPPGAAPTDSLSPCPKCGYKPQTAADALPAKGECPTCGIVVAKYRERLQALETREAELAAESPSDPVPEKSPDEAGEFPPATLKRRVLASLYTFFVILAILVACKIPQLAALRIVYPPSAITSWEAAAEMRGWQETVNVAKVVLTVLFVLLYIPFTDGTSWGQRKLGIRVLSRSGEVPGFKAYLLRFLGYLVMLGTYPVVILWQWVRNDWISLAERFSDTRLVEQGDWPQKTLLAALNRPIAYFLLLYIFSMPVTAWLVKPYFQTEKGQSGPKTQTEAKKPNSEALAFMEKGRSYVEKSNLLGTLSTYENYYFSKYERYTDDLTELIDEFGPTVEWRERAQALLDEGTLKARLSEAGYEIGVKVGENQWKIFSNGGHQANRAEF